MPHLKDIIIERIKREGPITFKSFMEMALYYPGLGYYNSERAPIGRRGDFYTASHLHPAFGAVIAKVLMDMWTFMDKPNNFYAVEIGGGAGYLCKDIFDYLNHCSEDKPSDVRNAFLKSLRYVMVEFNPYMRQRQVRLLEGYADRVKWVKSINELITGINGCILSNELLDSFPVHLIEMDDELREIYIDLENNNFIEIKQNVSTDKLIKYLKDFSINLHFGYRTEINLMIKDWLNDVASVLKRGFLLTIDYGYTSSEYYNEERTKGTMLCYHRHQFSENPYEHIGEQDITAHINFSSLSLWGKELGLKTIGYCSQGIFLIASGIDEIITELYGDLPDYQFIVTGIKGLILPQGMGETHKIMIQYKGKGEPELKGFSISNQIKNL